MTPLGFSWVERPLLAGLGRPDTAAEVAWLRTQGVQLLISLTENPLPRQWVNDAGLFNMHVPIQDMAPPSQKQIDLCVSAILKAKAQDFGVGVHCAAGIGRTGTVLACWFVSKDMPAQAAISRVRDLRPGSIETEEQVEAVHTYAQRRIQGREAVG